MDTPWDDAFDNVVTESFARDVEWTKMSSEFTDVGYREGITAGKEAAVQEGFDAGFADVGAPLGRDLGIVRGRSSAILGFLISAPSTMLGVSEEEKDALIAEAREIAAQLGNIRYSDIEPRDLEAEQHAREHLEMDNEEMEVSEEIEERKKMEGVEDMLVRMSAGENVNAPTRPTAEDVLKLKARLGTLCARLGLSIGY
ncbi:hypothetical protein Hypma_009245 [Hypsizygus marmoreus]|uniref:Protein YAE1 n=1 Tax=Hypsizygus marmoreus TaxID=39966 RepID=A0A369JTS0_HYPMA|nr:hypothetical protein Hypma_009245 [Hypsizygus marmoreus]